MHKPSIVTPLWTKLAGATVYNLPPPTQGAASLLILALFDRMECERADSFEHIHAIVEATKIAFRLRNAHVGDPDLNDWRPQTLLVDGAALDAMAAQIDQRVAAPWPTPSAAGDTVWFGAVDAAGCAVSAIQSTYFEFGSGIILPTTGITWQNRGVSFSLGGQGPNLLRAGAKPFHTLNPALAVFDDGRVMAYGTMGGEGQPQTQAAIFSRYARFGQDLQESVTAPRWLLGRTWGDATTTLKIEDRFPRGVLDRLRAAGHQIEIVAPMTSLMGHAGAIVRAANGALEGAADPRSEGAAAGY
jgi:gamma-glutamyltranspeptidase/glutathione hydrolase